MIEKPAVEGQDPEEEIKVNVSQVDNYEAVQFVALEGGEYQIDVQPTRWEECPVTGGRLMPLAVAWDVQPFEGLIE